MSGFGNQRNNQINGQAPPNRRNRDAPNNNIGRQEDRRGENRINVANQARHTGRSNGKYGEDRRDQVYQRGSSNCGYFGERDWYRMEEFRRTGRLGRYEEARCVSNYRDNSYSDNMHRYQRRWNDQSYDNQSGNRWIRENQENRQLGRYQQVDGSFSQDQYRRYQGSSLHHSRCDRRRNNATNSDNEPSTSDGRRVTRWNQNRRAYQEEELTPELKEEILASIMANLPQITGGFHRLPEQ